MIKELLINNVSIPLSEDIAIPINRSIIDIAEPFNRKGDFSKEFNIPASKEANKVFNYIFDINAVSSFNPNLKLPAIYKEDSETIIEGFVRMLNIIETDREEKFYQIALYGSISNIFREMGEKELDDAGMGWDDLDHVYDRTDQQNSWATSYKLNGTPTAFSIGSGYVYGLINYGRHTNLEDYDVEDLFPSIFAREYLLRMFTDAGYTWDSAFLDSTLFKSLMIPMNTAGEFGLSEASIDLRQFEVDTVLFDDTGLTTFTAVKSGFASLGLGEKLRFTNVVADPSILYNTGTGEFTVVDAGIYDLSVLLDLTVDFNPTGAANNSYANCVCQGQIIIVKNGFPIHTTPYIIHRDGTVVPAGETTTGAAFPDTDYLIIPNQLNYVLAPPNPPQLFTNASRNFSPPKNYAANAIDIDLQVGDVVEVYLRITNKRMSTVDGAGNLWGSGEGYFIDELDTTWTTSYDGELVMNLGSANSFFKNKVKNTQVINGNNVNMFDAIPKRYKQKDFFKGLINMFNLFLEPDEDNPTILKIEPRNDFYNNDVINWSQKHAIDRPTTSEPMGALEAREYEYTYKEDKDFYNTDYLEDWQRIYANREFEVNNDFETATIKTEVLFSPTPSVGFSPTDRIVPFIIQKDNTGQVAPIESNIRILYYGGLKSNNVPWNHTSIGTDSFQSTYPYLGMWDDPFNPTLDLGFGLTRKIYFDSTWGTVTATDANLFNTYYKQYVEEIIDQNSKLVRGWFALTTTDVRTADFRKLFYWDNAYFRLNRIMDYKANQLTQCEFLKLNFADPFQSQGKPLNGGKGEPLGDETAPIFNAKSTINDNSFDPKNGEIQGDDNYIARTAEDVKIQGDRNQIGDFAKNINLINSHDNIIEGGVENVTLINSDGLTVTESDVTYIDGEKVEAVTDYHSGFYKIVEGQSFIIAINKQSTNFGGLENDGDIILDGDLIEQP